jgi:DNA-binding LytR/AlgR family response regulator
MLLELESEAQIVEILDSVRSSLNWFRINEMPDLILADIQLADGISFELFNTIEITCPVIFTTAFDEYAITAFKHNGIDYLLKPIKKDELQLALTKFKKLQESSIKPNYTELLNVLGKQAGSYQKRIIIRFRDQYIMVDVEDVACFFVENKITYLVTRQNQQYQVDHTMDECENLFDPKLFFRINRQVIVHIQAISKMVAYSKSRVSLSLQPSVPFETIVSTERSAAFKIWLLGK